MTDSRTNPELTRYLRSMTEQTLNKDTGSLMRKLKWLRLSMIQECLSVKAIAECLGKTKPENIIRISEKTL